MFYLKLNLLPLDSEFVITYEQVFFRKTKL